MLRFNFAGQRIDRRYTIIKRIGEGAYSDVYLAEQSPHKAPVAIKILLADLDAKGILDFINEARQAVNLKHPNIMPIIDFGIAQEQGNRAFLVMPYTPNGDLRKKHPLGKSLSWETLVPYVKQVASALQEVHNNGLVHRDVKPQNMLIGTNNEVLLSDFGISIPSYTFNPGQLQRAAGTLAYIAPEQLNGQAVRQSDMYSLGIIMYEWLSGKLPFKGNNSAMIFKQINEQPAPLSKRAPNVTPQMETVVMRMIKKLPQERFADMREVIAQIDHISTPLANLGVSNSDRVKLSKEPTIKAEPSEPSLPVQNAVLREATRGLRTVAWSPDGQYIAAGGEDSKVYVWNAMTQQLISTYSDHAAQIWGLSWSPDSRSIASASDDETVQVWEALTGKQCFIYDEHTGAVHAVDWSRNGRFIASAGDDKSVQVWDASSGIIACKYGQHNRSVYAVAWSPDNRLLASAGDDRLVHLWDTFAVVTHHIYRGHGDRVNALSWSVNGEYVASGSEDKTVHILHALTGKNVSVYKGHTRNVTSVAWSPDNRYLASGSGDAAVHICVEIDNQSCSAHIGHASWVNSVSWAPDSIHLASCSWDQTVHIFSL